MKTLGPTMEKYLVQVIYKIILVLFIVLTAFKLVAHILVENISGLSAHQRENLERLNQSLIGKNITDLVQNSRRM
jgi:hypothetical protein